MTTTGVRRALADLAESAPVPDLAESALQAAQSRRRRRFFLAPVSVAAVVALAWLLPHSTIVRQAADVAPAGAAVSYDPNITTPWPLLRDLPTTLDEPLAFSYTVLAGSSQRVVGVSGHQWELPDGHSWITPSIAPDGRKVVWYDAYDQVLVVRDLAAGTERRVPATFSADEGTAAIAPEFPLHWNAAGTLLGFTGFDPSVSLLDVETGGVTAVPIRAQVVGWRDADTMVALEQSPEGGFTELVDITPDGSTHAAGSIAWPDDAMDSYPAPLTISPDGSTLGGLDVSAEQVASIVSWDLDALTMTRRSCPDCNAVAAPDSALEPVSATTTTLAGAQWVSSSEILVSLPAGGGQVFGAASADSGAVRPMVDTSPRLGEVDLRVVPAVVAGGATGELHDSGWWWGWYVDRIIYGAAAALLVGAALVVWRLAKQLRRR